MHSTCRRLVRRLPSPLGVAAAALHDLNEAGLVRIALNIDCYVIAVTECGFSVEDLGGLRPPLALLGTITVATGIILGLEADDSDGPSVLRDPAGTAKPASRAWRKILYPLVEGSIQPLRVRCPALDYLNEHGEASDRCGWEIEILCSADVTTAGCRRQYTEMLDVLARFSGWVRCAVEVRVAGGCVDDHGVGLVEESGVDHLDSSPA